MPRMSWWMLVLICCCLPAGAAAQVPVLRTADAQQPDSLRAQLQQAAERDPAWVSNANQLAQLYLASQPDSSLWYARQAWQQAALLDDQAGLALSNLLLGRLFASFGGYSRAVEHFFAAIEAYEALDDPRGLTITHNALGDLYYYTRQLQESLTEHRQALAIARDHAFADLEAITLGYLGHFYEKQGDYQQALHHQTEALELYRQLDDAAGLSQIYGNLGSVYEDLEEYNRAFEYFSLALEYNLQTDEEEQRIVHLNNLGDTFRKRGRYEEALRYTRQALNLARKLENNYQVKSSWRDLSKIYAGMGEYAQAHRYLDSAYSLHEELYNAESANQIARLQSLHEITQAQEELAMLKQGRRLARLTQWLLVGGLLLLTAFGLFIFRQQRQKNQQERELYQAQQALTQQELENSQLQEQQLKSELEAHSNQLSAHALSIVQKNNILRDIQTRLTHLRTQDKALEKPIAELLKRIDDSFHFDKDWAKFNRNFERVHPEFYRQLHDRFPDLTSSEIRLCALLRLNLDSKDIAAILGISQDSLRVSRYRLRKSLGLEKGVNLVTFIMNI